MRGRIVARRFAGLAWCILAIVCAAGLNGQQQTQQEKQQEEPKQPSPTADEAKVTEGLPAPVDPNAYKIGPEDVLAIIVWKEAELSSRVGVRPDGMITVNLIGEVQVNGLTPMELQARLKDEFGKIVINPIVQVQVLMVRSKKYYISGMVGRTGAFPLVVPTTVLEALTLAGGPTEFANKKKIVIMRGKERLFFNWDEVVKGKNLQQNIRLENGDFIHVK